MMIIKYNLYANYENIFHKDHIVYDDIIQYLKFTVEKQDVKIISNCYKSYGHIYSGNCDQDDIRTFCYDNKKLYWVCLQSVNNKQFAYIIYNLPSSTDFGTSDERYTMLNQYKYIPIAIVYFKLEDDNDTNIWKVFKSEDAIKSIYQIDIIDQEKWIPEKIKANDLSTYPIKTSKKITKTNA